MRAASGTPRRDSSAGSVPSARPAAAPAAVTLRGRSPDIVALPACPRQTSRPGGAFAGSALVDIAAGRVGHGRVLAAADRRWLAARAGALADPVGPVVPPGVLVLGRA